MLHKGESVWKMTLNRPKTLNALNLSMVKLAKNYLSVGTSLFLCMTLKGLTRIVKEAEASKTCRSIILAGEGRAFCAGGDVRSKFPLSNLQDDPDLVDSSSRNRARCKGLSRCSRFLQRRI